MRRGLPGAMWCTRNDHLSAPRVCDSHVATQPDLNGTDQEPEAQSPSASGAVSVSDCLEPLSAVSMFETELLDLTIQTRDHGGDLDRAIQTYGAGPWLDLSTGINARPYPVPNMPNTVWSALPTRSDIKSLEPTAKAASGTEACVVALAGAQAAIQLIPRLVDSGRACIVGPTYNEHGAALKAQGWTVEMIQNAANGAGADLVTVVNPNNPDGRVWDNATLLELADQVGVLVIDESFIDCTHQPSLATQMDDARDDIIVLRSFGKFYGLAGIRLGFVITGAKTAQRLRELAGPWSVNGPAIAIGHAALRDKAWQTATRDRLEKDAQRLDDLASVHGLRLVGGTPLFRTYNAEDAFKVQAALAKKHMWTRVFPYSQTWIRFGLPGTESDWTRLQNALAFA